MNINNTIQALINYCHTRNHAGYEPYDGLNSPLIRTLACKNKYLRIMATQLVWRCPFNIRPILGIQKSENAKGIGLFLWNYYNV